MTDVTRRWIMLTVQRGRTTARPPPAIETKAPPKPRTMPTHNWGKGKVSCPPREGGAHNCAGQNERVDMRQCRYAFHSVEGSASVLLVTHLSAHGIVCNKVNVRNIGVRDSLSFFAVKGSDYGIGPPE